MKSIKQLLPIALKWFLKKIIYFGSTNYCNVCKSGIKRFLPGGITGEAIKKYEIIGAGYHEHDLCPVCHAGYRQRLVKAYFDHSNLLEKSYDILHFAPAESLYYLLKPGKYNYICADIEPERYSYYAKAVYADMTHLDYTADSFDLVIANHVLEHIPDDILAMKEVYRVLKPGGQAILQVPFSEKIDKTFEDWSITKPEERLKVFGQKDHVRIYGKDYFDRLKSVGFRIEIFDAKSDPDIPSLNKLALDPRERVFVVHK